MKILLSKFFFKLIVSALVFVFLLQPLTPVFARQEGDSALNTISEEASAPESSNTDSVNLDDNQQSVDASAGQETEQNDKNVQAAGQAPSQSNSAQSPAYSSPLAQKLPEIDKNTGALNYNYPISVPPGRNNLQPSPSLSYNSSQNGQNSIFGYGWALNIPYIQRLNKSGLDKLYSDNYFYSSLDGELVFAGGFSYIPRTENGSFNKYTFSNNQWLVVAKDGTQYKFGYDIMSQQNDLQNPGNVYKWMLQEVRDTNNNYISYTYFKDAGQIYPLAIKYTGSGNTDGIFEIDFITQARPDVTTNYNTGFSVVTNYRVNQITTTVNSDWAVKYDLAYTAGNNGNRSALRGITESGRDEGGKIIIKPQTAFSYTNNSSRSSTTYNLPDDIKGFSNYADFADVNGDGLTDTLISYMVSGRDRWQKTYLNDGKGGWTESPAYKPPQIFIEAITIFDVKPHYFVDINGDGLSDLIVVSRNPSSGATIYPTYMNTGSGWKEAANLDLPHLGRATSPMDINGDGLPDFLINDLVYLNTGSSFVKTSYNFPKYTYTSMGSVGSVNTYYPNNSGTEGIISTDINGDGILDIMVSYAEDGYYYPSRETTERGYYRENVQKTWLGDGKGNYYLSDGYAPPTLFSFHENRLDNWNYDIGVRVADYNGDGLQDLIQSVNTDIGPSSIITAQRVFLNTGKGWAEPFNISLPYYFSKNGLLYPFGAGFFVFGNFSGNGSDEIYWPSTGNLGAISNSNDLLSSVTLNTGGLINISYKPSTLSKDSAGNLANPKLPMMVQTVSQISVTDPVNNIVSYEKYIYFDGTYYYNSPFDRNLAGFAEIDKTDSVGNVTKTYYNTGNGSDAVHGQFQDDYFKIGKVYRTEQYDNGGKLYRVGVNKWESYSLAGSAGFVKLVQTTQEDYDGQLVHKDKAETYEHDNSNGNVIQKTQWGEVTGNDDGTFSDIGNDKFTTNYVYAIGEGITGLASNVFVADQLGNKVKESRYYYDNLALGSVSLGNQTKEEDWISGDNYAVSQKTYNGYGLVTALTDPRDNATKYVYDAYNLYPAVVTNALDQTTKYAYDYSSGQVTQKIDANGNVFENTYDGLGRLLEEKQPNPAEPSTLVTKTTYAYVDAPNAMSIKKSSYLDASTVADSYIYFDGLGRKIQEKQEAEGINFSTKDYIYNNLGQLQKESLPYFSGSSEKTSATGDSTLYTTYTYDAVNRVISSINSVGSASNTYNSWKTTTTDANGKTKDFYRDAYGNLIRVDEHDTAVAQPSQNSTPTLSDGIVAYYKLDGNSNDYAGFNNGSDTNITYDSTNGKLPTVSPFGAGFSGVTSKIVLGTPISMPTNFTISAWTKIVNNSDYQVIFGDNDAQGVVSTWMFLVDNTNKKLRLDWSSGTGNTNRRIYQTNNDVIDTNWHFVTVTQIGTEAPIFYVDGSPVASSLVFSAGLDTKPTGQGSAVGIEGLYPNLPFKGSIDELGIWSRVLTSSEVSELYNNGAGKTYPFSQQASSLPSQGTFSTFYTYDYSGNLTNFIDALGNVRNFSYDGLGRRLTAEDLHNFEDITFGVWNYVYDNAGNLTSVTDPKNQTINYIYDTLNRKTSEDYAEETGVETIFSYDNCPNGKGLLCDTNSKILAEQYEYSALGSITKDTKIIDEKNFITQYSFDYLGNQGLITNPDGSQTKNIYNSAGLLEQVQRKESNDNAFVDVVSNFGYSPLNQITTQTNANGATTLNTYDPAKLYRLANKTTTGASGTQLQNISYVYDPVGNIIQETDNSATDSKKTVAYVYDGLYRLLSSTATEVALNQQTYAHAFTYNAIGNILTRTEKIGANSTTTYTYAYEGNIGQSFANPNAVTSISDGANTTTYIYDNNGNILQETPSSASKQLAKTYAFDYNNRLARIDIASAITDPVIVIDIATPPATNHPPVLNSIGSQTVNEGQVLSFAISAADADQGEVLTYYATGADGAVLPARASFAGSAFNWTPDYTLVSYADGQKNYTVIFSVSDGKDSNSAAINIMVNNVELEGDVAPRETNGDGRLSSADWVQVGRFSSGLDQVQNGIEFQKADCAAIETKGDGVLDTVDWVQAGRYTSALDLAQTAGGPTQPAIAPARVVAPAEVVSPPEVVAPAEVAPENAEIIEGACTQDSDCPAGTCLQNTCVFLTSFNYSNQNKIVPKVKVFGNIIGSATKSDIETITYDYDANGQRIKVVTNKNGVVTATYYPTQSYNIASDTQVVTKHIFAGSQNIATIQGGGPDAAIYYNHTDSLNSSSVMSDLTGTIAETMDYFPFGAIRLDTRPSTSSGHSAFSEQRKYIGQEYDADTGLNYLNARYYNSVIGRFLSQDPMFWSNNQNLADPQSLNSYSYANNNPIRFSDPTGFRAELVIVPISFGPFSINGAHSFIQITPESGADYSQYDGNGSHYTIGGYMSSRLGWSNQLVAKINEPGNYDSPAFQRIASYNLAVPEGLSAGQYDTLLLSSGNVYSRSQLGNYTATGQPLVNGGNCHNTSTAIITGTGGTMPDIQSSYNYSPTYGNMTGGVTASDARTYFAPGLGTPLSGVRYNQQATMSYASTAISIANQVLSSGSSISSGAIKTLSTLLSNASSMLNSIKK